MSRHQLIGHRTIRQLVMLSALMGPLLGAFEAQAVKIEFPEEELARESVLPVFDNPEAVKRRTVETAGRVELGLLGGWSLNDALWDPLTFGGMLTYHFTEFHAVQLMGGIFSASPSQYQAGLEQDGQIYNLKNAPRAQNFWLFNYQFTPYYGKISITKQTVLNLGIYFTAGAGQIRINGAGLFAYSFGLGQKLYFGKHWSLRADLRVLNYSAPDPFSVTLPADSTPDNSAFGKKSVSNGLLTVGANYLF